MRIGGAADPAQTCERSMHPGLIATILASLHAALSGRHPRMPDFSLAREQIDDLSAYLRTLRK